MPTTTTNYGLRKPVSGDAADLVIIGGNLADDVDTVLNTQLPPLSVTYRATTTLSVAAASVTFSSIPSTLRVVTVYWTARGDSAVINVGINCRVNGDSSTVYSGQKYQASNTTMTVSTFVTQASADVGSILAGSATAGRFASGDITIAGWDAHAKLNGITRWGAFDVAATNAFNGSTAFMYEAASPFTSITLFPSTGNFVASSEFVLVGWK